MKAPQLIIQESQEIKKAIKQIMFQTQQDCDEAFARQRKKDSDLSPDQYDSIYDTGARRIFDLLTTYKTKHN